MADPNTCAQCGTTNKTVQQSGKGRLLCQACYEKENPPVEVEGKQLSFKEEKKQIKA